MFEEEGILHRASGGMVKKGRGDMARLALIHKLDDLVFKFISRGVDICSKVNFAVRTDHLHKVMKALTLATLKIGHLTFIGRVVTNKGIY